MLPDATFSAIFGPSDGNTSVLPDAFGAYFWGGFDVPNALVPGLVRLQQTGFASTARILLNRKDVHPRLAPNRGSYRFDAQWEAQVPLGVPFLPAAVRSTQYQQAFSLPGLRTFVFTAYDSTSEAHLFAEDGTAWLEANAELVRSEYRDMTVALYCTQNGTDKRFIVCNWETDSHIFWEDPPAETSARWIRALKRWFRLRQEGIREGRRIATNQGLGGVEVNDAIEFNSLHFQRQYRVCFPGGFVGDTLHNIINDVKPDYASYSAWESSGRGRLYQDLFETKRFLREQTGGHTQLMLGELGVPEHSRFSLFNATENLHTKAWLLVELAHAAIRAGIPVIILWKAWDNFGIEREEGNGLLHLSGSERPVLKYLQKSFHMTGDVNLSEVTIAGVNDQFDINGQRSDDGRRSFELYPLRRFPDVNNGDFSDPEWKGHYEAIIAYADGETVAVDTTGENERQINIALRPHRTSVRWFMLRLRRNNLNMLDPDKPPDRETLRKLTSAEFGPIRLNRIPPITDDCKGRVTQRFWDFWQRP